MLLDLPPDAFQRVIDLSDRADLFLLRLVSRAFRQAVEFSIKRIAPTTLPANLATKLPNVETVDLRFCEEANAEGEFAAVLSQFSKLREVIGWEPIDDLNSTYVEDAKVPSFFKLNSSYARNFSRHPC